MKAVLVLKSLAAWCVILCLAVANGALREALLIPALGRQAGLVLSGVLLSVLNLLVAYGFARLAGGLAILQGLLIGLLWLCLTLAFEFTFGLYVRHKPLAELLDAYTFKDGNIWPMVLVATFLAPSLAARFHVRSRRASP
jgi:hypothetical protein